MILGSVILSALAAVLASGAAAPKEHECKVQSSLPPGQFKFVRIYDPTSGAVIWGQAVNGGDSKRVTSNGPRVRIETKLPGHTKYVPAGIHNCSGGKTIRV